MFDYYKAYTNAENAEEKFNIFVDWVKTQGLMAMFALTGISEYDQYDKEEFIAEFDEEIKKLLY